LDQRKQTAPKCRSSAQQPNWCVSVDGDRKGGNASRPPSIVIETPLKSFNIQPPRCAACLLPLTQLTAPNVVYRHKSKVRSTAAGQTHACRPFLFDSPYAKLDLSACRLKPNDGRAAAAFTTAPSFRHNTKVLYRLQYLAFIKISMRIISSSKLNVKTSNIQGRLCIRRFTNLTTFDWSRGLMHVRLGGYSLPVRLQPQFLNATLCCMGEKCGLHPAD
jgi:hypothetical protein